MSKKKKIDKSKVRIDKSINNNIRSSVRKLNPILKAFGHEEKVAKNVLIIGGGNIGLNLAKMLEENFEDIRIKIIEKDK